MAKKLFVSVTGLISAFEKGKVLPEELDTGLFYFRHLKEYVFGPFSSRSDNILYALARRIKDKEKRDRFFTAFTNALAKAEAEGRVLWPADGKTSFTELNELLKRNDLQVIKANQLRFNGVLGVFPRVDSYNYNFPSVEEAMKLANPEIDVVWHN